MNMERYARLSVETREGLIDKVHLGYICCMDQRGRVILSAGDVSEPVFIRSAAKPIQALPTLQRALDLRYGLTEEETTLFAGSHLGQDCHIRALKSMLEKTGLKEEYMCMHPCRPESRDADDARIRAGQPLSRLYHNCSGKHVALMLLQRELGGPVEDYWKRDAACQREVLRTISVFTEVEQTNIRLGVDGCGVPVFAVPMRNIAAAFLNLVRPGRVRDDALGATAEKFVPRIHKYSYMIKGYGSLCSLLCAQPNLIAKGGANGLYCAALKKEGIGIAFRTIDGDAGLRPLVLAAIFKKLGVDALPEMNALGADRIINDTGEVVGEARAEIEWN